MYDHDTVPKTTFTPNRPKMQRPFGLTIGSLLLNSLLPLGLVVRLLLKKEQWARLSERRGYAAVARPKGQLLWLHGASLGETSAYLPLIAALRQDKPDLNFLITSGTITSARFLENTFLKTDGQRFLAHHQFIPFDTTRWVRRFLDHWQPDGAVFIDSDLWPNLICESRKRALPMVLLNAKISERSQKRYQRLGLKNFRYLMDSFSCIIPQDEQQHARLQAMGAEVYPKSYNLKAVQAQFSQESLLKVGALSDKLVQAHQANAIWIAASTHAPEEELCLKAHQRVLATHPQSLLLIAARHIERNREILALAKAQGLQAQLLSSFLDDDPQKQSLKKDERSPQVIVIDQIGLLAQLYTIAQTAYIGGSLNQGLGGHNLYEPARAALVLAHGPDMENQKGIAQRLASEGAVQRVTNAHELATFVLHCLDNPAQMRAKGERAYQAVQEQSEQLIFFKTLLLALLSQGER